jgi:predicted O-methyltransferase YrrM
VEGFNTGAFWDMIDKRDFPRDINFNAYTLRPAISHVKEKLGRDLVGVEIGVYLGMHAEYLLHFLDIKKLFLVDPYEEYGDKLRAQQDWNEIYEWISGIFSDRDNVQMIRMRSEHACNLFRDNSLDFVYIDGDHSYNNVFNDLGLYWNKVKPGGVLCGHDFLNPDVHGAVLEFATMHKKEIHDQMDVRIGIPDWWIDKE